MKEKNTDSLNKKLIGYSVASAAILGAGTSNAQIYGTSVNQTVHNSTYTISFDGNNKFRFSQSTFTGVLGTTNTGAIKPLSVGAGWVRNGTHPKALASGYVVSAGKSFQVPGNTNVNRFLSYRYTNILHLGSTPLGGSFVGAGNKYIGVKFKIGANTHYGWVKVNVPSRVANLQIISYAFEYTAGNSITANGVLPVELTYFNAVNQHDNIVLNWNTATEVNNYGFEIERNKYPEMKDGEPVISNWEKIGFVNGYGNSNSPKDYSFRDKSAPAGLVMYRLKQIDFDGQFIYSDIVTVNLETKNNFELNQNYPNPFNPVTQINYTIPSDQSVKLKIYDALGQEVKVLVDGFQTSGNKTVAWNGKNNNGEDVGSGFYFYRIEAGDFIQSKKMLIIK